MRHRKAVPKLGRTAAHRRALLRNLATSLLDKERLFTTEAKAKALRPYAERLITLGKRGTLHARRHALRFVHGAEVARKLFDELAPRYAQRAGGYTRIVKVGARPGDAASMAMIQLLPAGEKTRAELAAKKRKKTREKSDAPATASVPAAGAQR
jgi:large subunit ribosomal protein L17